jgi:hypothetical protein
MRAGDDIFPCYFAGDYPDGADAATPLTSAGSPTARGRGCLVGNGPSCSSPSCSSSATTVCRLSSFEDWLQQHHHVVQATTNLHYQVS